jgi:tetratricopeptide (TPR) repeat protein
VRVAYLATVAVLGLAAIPLGGRTWGFDAWRGLPKGGWVALAVAAAAAPFVGRWMPAGRGAGDRMFLWGVLAAGVAAFAGLRARAAFLGDGAQVLALLASGEALPKATAPATWLLLGGLTRTLGGDPERAARIACLAVSIGSGIAFLLAAWFLGGRLVETPRDRRLLLLLLAAGGWSLQFFGYPETYAPLLAAVGAYALAGAWTARTGRGRGVAVLLAGWAAALHVVGLALLPSLLLLLTPARFAPRLRRARVAVPAAAAAVLLGALAVRAFADDLAVRLVFVPLVPDRFGAAGYTLFSMPHLADIANLLFLLLPGAAVLLAARRRAPADADPAAAFLGVLAISTAATAFVLDPKLGMPRDWDLLAFAGPPLAAAWALPLLSARADAAARRAVALAAVLGALVLVPRAITNADEHAAYVQFRRHLALDPARGRSARHHAVAYLRRIGREDLAGFEADRWDADYPERILLRGALEARERGDLAEAIRLNLAAIDLAPDFADPWNNLGSCYLHAGRLEEALEALHVARGLNPNLPGIWSNIGTASFLAGDLDEADRWWTRALRRSPESMLLNRSLARLAQRRGDRDAYARHLESAAASEDADPAVLREWADHLAATGRTSEAQAARREADAREAAPPANSPPSE